MNDSQLDQLLEQKIHQAKSGKLLRYILIVLLCLCLGALVFSLRGCSRGAQPEEPPLPTVTAPTLTPTMAPAPSASPTLETPVVAAFDLVEHSLALEWPENADVPEEVRVRVLHGGTELHTLHLNAQNHWGARWEDSYPAEELTLTAELPVGYTAETEIDGERFSVHVVKLAEEAAPTGYYDSHLPQTGRTLWPIPALLVTGVLFLILSCQQTRRAG